MQQHDEIAAWIERYLEQHTPRARSLIVTLFGDTLMPYCERVWVGNLIALLAPFGINERLVRTSVYRLSEAGWLTAERNGRHSYYTLAPAGQRRFRHAYERVYQPPRAWEGGWVVAIVSKSATPAQRTRLRRELEWEGFATAANGVFLRPADNPATVREVIDSVGLGAQIAVFEARAATGTASPAIAALATESWTLAPAAGAYADFNARFATLLPQMQRLKTLLPERAFVIQTLMIDAFRWATLRDPQLPAPLLPADWPGHQARTLCHALYRHLYVYTRQHFAATAQGGTGTAAVPAPIAKRFGGL